MSRWVCAALLVGLGLPTLPAQQVTGDDLAMIQERADRLLEEAKSGYESARASSSASGFIDAGFKLEEARIKYIVLQELGQGEKQKLAGDRIRAVNQLAKLIHDGRVAVSGSPAEPSSPKTPDPAKADPASALPEAKAAVDVTRRLSPPEAPKQKDAERQVRELYKDQYAKKAPEDRRQLSRLLLDQAQKSESDPLALWVLLREAQEAAVLGGDVKAALEAIDRTTRVYDVDPVPLKNTVLSAIGKTSKAPEDFVELVEAQDRLIDELIRADQFDLADKTATSALVNAKKAADAALLTRMTTRSKEVAEAKTLYQSMKSVLETLAKNPADAGANLETGKFLCFVKGGWEMGLRFLVKGSDAALKGLAEKELAMPTAAIDRAAIGDAWFDLLEKEKSPLRRSQLQSHVRTVYESSLPDAPPLVRAKVEKRLESLRTAGVPMEKGPVNILSLIDVKQDSVKGDWTMEGRILVSPATQNNPERIALPYLPPDEFDLLLVLERRQGSEAFQVMVPSGSAQCAIVLDSNGTSGIDVIDGKVFGSNASTYSGKVFMNNKSATVVCAVRKGGITVTVDGKSVIRWQGNRNSLAAVDYFRFPNPKQAYVGCGNCRYAISKIVLTTVSGEGKKLR